MDIQHSVNGYQQLLNKLTHGNEISPEEPLKQQQRPVSDYSDKVSLSYQADKMKAISREFFSGTIHSSQIPALTQRLYEEGFISSQEFKQLGGNGQKVSAVSESAAFVNNWVVDALKKGDMETAKNLVKVADALANVNSRSTLELRQAEAEAFEIMSQLADQKKQDGAEQSMLDSIQKVLDVFSALAKVRNSEQVNGAIAGYEQVEQAYDELLQNN